jgi:hypothetical protein
MSQMPMVPRPGVYENYWDFASERQAVFEKRAAGMPKPWTDNPIIQTFKFCNVYRASDRVSQYLIKEVIYDEEASSEADALFRIVAFRMFSSIETWQGLRNWLGRQPNIADLRNGQFLRAIESVKASNRTIYTGAFILCATDAYGHREKHLNHVALFMDMFAEGGLTKSVLGAKSMAEVFAAIKTYPLMGDFMSYQLAIDINYSELTDFSESSFVQPGPGALRGLKKMFTSLGGHSPGQAIMWMVENQDAEFERLGLPFAGLSGRPLQAIDCQGLFCEVDKYCREAVPWLTSSRSRIKQRFSPSMSKIEYFFPPKWGINSTLEPSLRQAVA